MMDVAAANNKASQSICIWIISLATCIVFCAFIFLIFAGYLLDMRKSMAIADIRLETVDNRLTGVNNDIAELRRALAARVQAQPPVVDMGNPAVSTTNINGVTVVRGQLPATATINNQPVKIPDIDMPLPPVNPAPVPDVSEKPPVIQTPTMAPPSPETPAPPQAPSSVTP